MPDSQSVGRPAGQSVRQSVSQSLSYLVCWLFGQSLVVRCVNLTRQSSSPSVCLNHQFVFNFSFSFLEKQIAYGSPLALDVNSSDPCKEDHQPPDEENDVLDATITPISGPTSHEKSEQMEVEAVVNVETGEDEEKSMQDLNTASVNDGLLAIYSGKQEEESNDSETSLGPTTVSIKVEEYPREIQDEERTPPTKHPHLGEHPREIQDGESTPLSKHPHLGEVGKQQPLQGEPVTPDKDSSFTSSAGSTPVEKLIIPSAESSMTESSSTAAEDVREDSGTPRQKELSPRIADEYLQFWLVMRIFDDKVTIFFHRR